MAYRNKEMSILKEEVFILIDLQKHEAWCTIQQDRGTWGSTSQVGGGGRRNQRKAWAFIVVFVEKECMR